MERYVVISGGTGLLGTALVKELSRKSYRIILLARRKIDTLEGVKVDSILWDSEKPGDVREEIESIVGNNSYVLINLAGYPIAKSKWSDKIKQKILNSRVNGTEYLSKELCRDNPKLSLFVSASAVGYYGDTIAQVDEESTKGHGFLSDVCHKWEAAALHSKVDTKIIRIGVVLSKDGGALEKMMLPYKYFVGGTIGSGKQFVPWIHIEDLVSGIIHIIEHNPSPNIYNMVASNQKTMKEFSKELAGAMKRPNLFPVPSIILKVVMGEMSTMILEGQKVEPENLLNSGFKFKFPYLKPAIVNILNEVK